MKDKLRYEKALMSVTLFDEEILTDIITSSGEPEWEGGGNSWGNTSDPGGWT